MHVERSTIDCKEEKKCHQNDDHNDYTNTPHPTDGMIYKYKKLQETKNKQYTDIPYEKRKM